MQNWILSVRPATETGLPSVDVAVRARPDATVVDLARSLGRHLAPDQRTLLLVPHEGGQLWPAERRLSECGLRTGDLVDVGPAPGSWRDRPAGTSGARAVLRVVDGPDRGARVRVAAGQATIGRAAGCTLQAHRPAGLPAARPHRCSAPGPSSTTRARPTAPPSPAHRPPPARWTGARRSGSAGPPSWWSPATSRTPSSPVSVFRPPRFGDPLRDEVLDLPAPPSRNRPTPLPWAMLMLPMVMGAAILMRSHALYALVYMLAWPILGGLGWWQQRRTAEKQFQEELAEWRIDVEEMLDLLDEHALRQRERMFDDFPDEETLRARAASRDPYLWARAEDRSAFLTTRVGIGPVSAMLRGTVRDGGDRKERRKAVAEVQERDVLEELPVLADLTQHALVAITGVESSVDSLARAMLLRIAFDHSPAEISIAACLGRSRRHHEAWLRWLPHTAARLGGDPPVAVGSRASIALLEHLVSEGEGFGHTICVVDEDAGVPRRTVEAVAQAAGRARRAPGLAGPQDRRGAGRHRAARRPRRRHGRHPRPDGDRAARRAGRRQPGPRVAARPLGHGLRGRGGGAAAEHRDPLDRPAARGEQRPGGPRRAQDGAAPLAPGVRTARPDRSGRRRHGHRRPARGRTARPGRRHHRFRQERAAAVADLLARAQQPAGRGSPSCSSTTRAVRRSASAPTSRTRSATSPTSPRPWSPARSPRWAPRSPPASTCSAATSVKDLVQLEREHPEAAPPSLLICVDEFAALTNEVPEFVDGMVNLAQRGRSLGMHLLLATQRPGRRRDRADPRQHRPAHRAAGLLRRRLARRHRLPRGGPDLPSHAGARVDTPHRPRHRRAGAVGLDRRPRAADRRRGRGAWSSRSPPRRPASPTRSPGADVRLDPRTDLERCVRSIQEAFVLSEAAPPHRPWLPLAPVGAAAQRRRGRSGSGPSAAPAGSGSACSTSPRRRPSPSWSSTCATVGHVLVHGASGSGKTELLRTAVLSASVGDASGADGVPPYVYARGLRRRWPDCDRRAAHRRGSRRRDPAGPGAAAAAAAAAHRERASCRAGQPRLLRRRRPGSPRHPRCPASTSSSTTCRPSWRSLEAAGAMTREHLDHFQQVLQNGRRVGVHVDRHRARPGRRADHARPRPSGPG